jgi:hypothetical protein
MTELVPTNGEELEWVNQIPYNGHVPKAEDNDGHCDYLFGSKEWRSS